jgi:hypothetical protein
MYIKSPLPAVSQEVRGVFDEIAHAVGDKSHPDIDVHCHFQSPP